MKKINSKKLARIFFCMMVISIVVMALCGLSFAEGEAAPAAAAANGMGLLAAAISTGVAGIGAGIAVGAGAPAAIGALTEDPKTFGKSLIFVALGEGIALYGMLVSILILNKA